jgi:hypothetical protein
MGSFAILAKGLSAFHVSEFGETEFVGAPREQQLGVPHIPDFLWSFVGSLNFMRLSLKSRTRGSF